MTKSETKTPPKNKRVKGWAVVWPGWDKFVTPAHHSTEATAIFSTYARAKKFASAYTAQSIMKVVKCEITYTLPTPLPKKKGQEGGKITL